MLNYENFNILIKNLIQKITHYYRCRLTEIDLFDSDLICISKYYEKKNLKEKNLRKKITYLKQFCFQILLFYSSSSRQRCDLIVEKINKSF